LIPKSEDDIVEFINKSSSEINVSGTWFQLAIIKKATNQLIGDIGIHFLTSNSKNGQVEIGYTLNKTFQGKGYAIEAISAVIDYLFNTLNKHRIIASIDPINLISYSFCLAFAFGVNAKVVCVAHITQAHVFHFFVQNI